MKLQHFVAVCLLALLGISARTAAQENRFDIDMEGPWILYVDSSHRIANWPVLIAIAPNTHSETQWQHQPTQVTTGEGYVLADYNDDMKQRSAHVYCFKFDGICAPKGHKFLQFHDYPDGVGPLQVRHSGGWDWIKAAQQFQATVLILPVPDSYSSDGAWWMRFGAKFDPSGKSYGLSQRYSIGVQLHYGDGPKYFDLDACGYVAPIKCGPANPQTGSTHLLNTGTLRIAMKAPLTNWWCDPHVRRVYPHMLEIVGADANPQIQVVDPAHNVNSSGGVYDEDETEPENKCLKYDSQGSKFVGHEVDDSDPRTRPPNPLFPPPPVCTDTANLPCDWFDALHAFVKAIQGGVKGKGAAAPNERALVEQILDAAKEENQQYPRLSQIDRLQYLIDLQTKELKGQGNKDAHALSALGNSETATALLLNRLSIANYVVHANPQDKTPNDCKAMVMVVQD